MKSNGRLAALGWLATVAVAGAWAVSDGRPARELLAALDSTAVKALHAVPLDRVASLIETERMTRPKPDRDAAPHPFPSPPDRTGSIRPSARPEIQTRKAETERPAASIPLPLAAPMLPFDKPAMALDLRHSAPTPPAPLQSAGDERHATRALAAHTEPDGTSAKVAEIDSGSSLVVLRSAGAWRYVRAARSGAEGWVDGRFLAGEGGGAPTASELATLARQDFTAHRR